MNNQKIAKIGENIACKYLIQKNYSIIGRNVKYREGEIDIIAQKAKQLVFIEVKARTSLTWGYPEEALTVQKKKNFLKAINRYLLTSGYMGNYSADLIAIDLIKNQAKIRHYKSIELED